MRVRGRYLVIAWTAVFLAAVGTIALRSRSGFRIRLAADSLQVRIKALESSKAELEAGVRKLASRPELVPKAELLGLHTPSDSDLVILRVRGGH